MDSAKAVEKFLSYHVEPSKHEAQMCYVVFSDGEICLTKGGDLLFSRTLHLIERGWLYNKLDTSFFPKENQYNGYGFICVNEEEDAQTARALIRNYAEQEA